MKLLELKELAATGFTRECRIEPKIWNGSTTLQVTPSKMQQHSAGADFTDQVNIAPLIGGAALLGTDLHALG